MKLLQLLAFAAIALTAPSRAEKTEKSEPKTGAAIGDVAEHSELKQQRKTTEAEGKAIETFRAKLGEVKAAFSVLREASMEAEAKAHQLTGQLAALLAKVGTEGLPEDLTQAFAAYTKSVQAGADLVKEMPKDEAKIMEWMADKMGDEKFNEEMAALSDRQYEQESKFVEMAAQFGIKDEAQLYSGGEVDEETKDRWLVILGAYKEFPEAKTDAVAFAKATKVPFSMNGMIFDKKGLRLPEDSEDTAYAGEYLLRRYNGSLVDGAEVENHVSIEKSEAYEGFEPGFYLIIGSIAESSEDAEKELAKFKAVAKKAYVVQTRIYLGCIH